MLFGKKKNGDSDVHLGLADSAKILSSSRRNSTEQCALSLSLCRPERAREEEGEGGGIRRMRACLWVVVFYSLDVCVCVCVMGGGGGCYRYPRLLNVVKTCQQSSYGFFSKKKGEKQKISPASKKAKNGPPLSWKKRDDSPFWILRITIHAMSTFSSAKEILSPKLAAATQTDLPVRCSFLAF